MKTRKKLGKLKHLIVLISTTEKVERAFLDLKKLVSRDFYAIDLKQISLGVEDIRSENDYGKVKKIIFDLFEKEPSCNDLIIASAGRKEITQALQEAGQVYGCKGYLSVTSLVGKLRYEEVRAQPEKISINWYPTKVTLAKIAENTRRFQEKEKNVNFSSLYALPKMITSRLKKGKIGLVSDSETKINDLKWIVNLPKTDLHCHLGGCAGPKDLKRIAEKIIEASDHKKEDLQNQLTKAGLKKQGEDLVKDLRDMGSEDKKGEDSFTHPLSGLKSFYKEVHKKEGKLPIHLINAVQISLLSEEELEKLMYEPLKDKGGVGIETYMAAGDFGGSTLLQSREGIEEALKCLFESCVYENVRYLELRISPLNYTKEGLGVPDVMEIILQQIYKFSVSHEPFRVNLIIMATRHKERAAIVKQISTAITYCQSDSILLKERLESACNGKLKYFPIVSGVDLAGKEKFQPALFNDLFQPLHYHFRTPDL